MLNEFDVTTVPSSKSQVVARSSEPGSNDVPVKDTDSPAWKKAGDVGEVMFASGFTLPTVTTVLRHVVESSSVPQIFTV